MKESNALNASVFTEVASQLSGCLHLFCTLTLCHTVAQSSGKKKISGLIVDSDVQAFRIGKAGEICGPRRVYPPFGKERRGKDLMIPGQGRSCAMIFLNFRTKRCRFVYFYLSEAHQGCICEALLGVLGIRSNWQNSFTDKG